MGLMLLTLAATTSAVARAPEDGLTRITVASAQGGGDRSAWVRVPKGAGPWPVVLAFHGGHNNSGMEMAPRFRSVSDENVLFVFPNGLNTAPREIGWIGPGQTVDGQDPGRDVHFVRDLVRTVGTTWNIDRNRIYAAGFSNGAYMTHLLRCEASDVLSGFAMVSRAVPIPVAEICRPAVPRPTMLILGTADPGLHNEYQLSVQDSLAMLREHNGCAKKATATVLPDRGDNTVVTHTVWTRCDAPLEYYEIEGGGHSWPGHGKPGRDRSMDLDASSEILRFLLDDKEISDSEPPQRYVPSEWPQNP